MGRAKFVVKHVLTPKTGLSNSAAYVVNGQVLIKCRPAHLDHADGAQGRGGDVESWQAAREEPGITRPWTTQGKDLFEKRRES